MITEQIAAIVSQASGLMVRNGFEIKEKGSSANIVTSSDLAVQHFLVERLGALLPGSGFLCEEEDLDDLSHEYIWIIDPIDGTANYARGMSECCISVGLAKGGEVIAGVVYVPWQGKMYRAEKGAGAFCNDRAIHVSSRSFEDGMLCGAYCTYYKEHAKACSDIMYDIFMESNDFRRYGSAAVELCLLAAGDVELYFEMRLQPWDFAAGGLMIQEAGGCFRTFGGAPVDPFKPGMIIAANSPSSLDRLVSIVGRHLPELPYSVK